MPSEDAAERISIARHHDRADFGVSLGGHLFALRGGVGLSLFNLSEK